ncbi:hypothetical protein ACFL6F_04260, partial [Planctomycetota bacterium]
AAIHFKDRLDLIQRTPWWVISVVFHAAFLLMAAMWVVSSSREQEAFSIFEMNVKTFKKPEYDPTLKRDIKRSNKEVKDEVQVENPVITKEDLEIDELETPDNMEREHKARGRQEAMSTIELQGDGWVGVFGVGGGGSGTYGWRDGGGKKRALGRFGGGAASESAVLAALRWFKQHQRVDGGWSFHEYWKECKLNPNCEHRADLEKYPDGDNGATGFALLCFLGAGHTHKAGKFRQQVSKGLEYLKKHQKQDGSFCKFNYVNGIATMALAEAYGMTKSQKLKEPAQKSVDHLLAQQNADGYLGWNYRGPSDRTDMSVTGWAVMGLKSAKSADLNIGNSFEGITNVLEKTTKYYENNGESERKVHLVNYSYIESQDKGSGGSKRLIAVGMLCRIFVGQDTQGQILRAHAERVLQFLPSKDYKEADLYLLYYGTLAMFQMGKEYWNQWNERVKTLLCDNQRKDGCNDGSWDAPAKGNASFNKLGGRLFATAVACLSLEVYYRYLPIAMLK